METGSELSKTVAIFIVQKILLDDLGLQYICQTYERFYAVGAVLANMVAALVESQAVRLLKHVVRCYLRMSDNPRWVDHYMVIDPDATQSKGGIESLSPRSFTRRHFCWPTQGRHGDQKMPHHLVDESERPIRRMTRLSRYGTHRVNYYCTITAY